MGDLLLKFLHVGNPHERFFRVDKDAKTIYWEGGEKEKKKKWVELRDISEVSVLGGREEYVKARAERRSSNGLLGLLTGVASSFALNTGYYCFSLIHKNGERPLNLIAPNKALFDLWLFGLRSIIEEAKEKEEKQRPQQQPSSEPTEARDNNDEQADEVLVGVSANNSADNNKIENKIKNENGNVNKSMPRGLHHLAPRPELKHQYDTLESFNEASQDEHLSDDDDSCA